MIDLVSSQENGNLIFLTDEKETAKANHVLYNKTTGVLNFIRDNDLIKEVSLAKDTATVFLQTANNVMVVLMENGVPTSYRPVNFKME